ncbi:glutamate--tRNA ligase, partial [Candidatus Woesebacteria bacterium]|nr:glutamate--tRNA ligase [Candidatus Woesebacteria bacterium]
VEGSEERILSSLHAYGIETDEDVQKGGAFAPYRQSERLDIYQKYAKELISSGHAYYCTCSKERLDEVRKEMQATKQIPRYDKYCLKRQDDVKKAIDSGSDYVIRLDVPVDTEVVFQDVIRGEVKINTNNLDDQVLMKSDGFPTYHLAVVVDDYLMEISHVIRAEEWISSTPKHILLYQAFGWELPIFAHVPILRNPDKSKLSKRKNPVWASWYLAEGFLPEAVLNYLSLMGWSHPDEKEIFTREEFMHVFTLERVQPVGPVFDIKKLEWMNGQYIMRTENEKLNTKILNFIPDKKLDEGIVEKSIPLVKERMKTLKDYWSIAAFLFERPTEFEQDFSDSKELIQKVAETLTSLSEWKAEQIGEAMQDLATAENVPFGKFFMMLRILISGKKVTPPLNDSMEILGKEECVARLQ